MAFLALLPALIAAAATTGTAIAGSVEQDNANKQAAQQAAKQRAFQLEQNQKEIAQEGVTTSLGNQTNVDNAQQGQYANAVNTIQGAAAQRQKELEGVGDSIARSLVGSK